MGSLVFEDPDRGLVDEYLEKISMLSGTDYTLSDEIRSNLLGIETIRNRKDEILQLKILLPKGFEAIDVSIKKFSSHFGKENELELSFNSDTQNRVKLMSTTIHAINNYLRNNFQYTGLALITENLSPLEFSINVINGRDKNQYSDSFLEVQIMSVLQISDQLIITAVRNLSYKNKLVQQSILELISEMLTKSCNRE